MAPSPPKPPSPPKEEKSNVAKAASWVFFALLIFTILAFFSNGGNNADEQVRHSEFLERVEEGNVFSVQRDNTNGEILFELNDDSGTIFSTTGAVPIPDAEFELLQANVPSTDEEGSGVIFINTTPSVIGQLILFLLPVGLIILFFVWMQRRAQGQVGGIMNVGRSKAKTYTTERPATTFDDVAGYEGVKREITEVVDFLRTPDPVSYTHLTLPTTPYV